MNELTLDGKTYVSSKRAAELTGYAKDYVGQLCREGHVEARLVGRNWYVLESSIREHRFGMKEEEKETEQKADTSTWEAPRYEPEFPSYIAPISPREEVVFVEQKETDEIPSPVKPAILGDIQSAWQEWFEKKEDAQQEYQEEKTQDPVPEDESDDTAVPLHTLDGDNAAVVSEEDVEEEGEEVMIPITTYSTQKPLDLSKVVREDSEYIDEPVEEVEREGKGSTIRNAANVILRSLFVGIAIIAIAITAIGTGIYSKFAGTSTYRLTEINVISGTSIYNK